MRVWGGRGWSVGVLAGAWRGLDGQWAMILESMCGAREGNFCSAGGIVCSGAGLVWIVPTNWTRRGEERQELPWLSDSADNGVCLCSVYWLISSGKGVSWSHFLGGGR